MTDIKRICSQCGQDISMPACGPTHAIVFHMAKQTYTQEQMEYIHAVEGDAHITAVEIIGELCAKLDLATNQRDELRDVVQSFISLMTVHDDKFITTEKLKKLLVQAFEALEIIKTGNVNE